MLWLAGALCLMVGIVVLWSLLGRMSIVPPPHWHVAEAWTALWHRIPLAAFPSTGAEHPSIPRAQPSVPRTGPTHLIPVTSHAVSRSLPILAIGWWALGLAVAVGIIWAIWGSLVWLYNTPDWARTWAFWCDWLLWRWPIVTYGQLTKNPDLAHDAWGRHKRLWQQRTVVAQQSTLDETRRAMAQALQQGFEMSHPDVVWQPLPDQTVQRRIVIMADDRGIHPQWPLGFHAETMQRWIEWATQWAEIALHHAGFDGHWVVTAEGYIRPRSAGEPASNAHTSAVPPPAPPPKIAGIDPGLQWGAHGLTWGELAPLAPKKIPMLTEPLPPAVAEEVMTALRKLKFPDVEVVGGVRGLAVDVIEIRPEPTTANRLLNRNVALSLAGQLGHGNAPLRVAYVQGKPGIMAIERPRPDRQFVDVLTALARTAPDDYPALHRMMVPVCVGVTPTGRVLWSDAAIWPHALVGGTTGGGKTTALNAWLASVFVTVPPSRLRITLLDPKAGSQFPWAAKVPHVDQILTNPGELSALVAEWAAEQDARYAQFAAWGVMDLASAHRVGHTELPFRLLVMDEYKDAKDQMDKETLEEFERNVGRLGQKARGSGLFLWVTTQNPSVEDLGSTFKGNLPTRIALRTSDVNKSRVILDQPGAETLLGKGDAFFRPGDSANLVRLQTPSALNDNLWTVIAEAWQHRGAD